MREESSVRRATTPVRNPDAEDVSPVRNRAAFAPLTPVSFLLRSAKVWATRPAISFQGRSTAYVELLERVERVAGALRGAGVEGGDRVATLLPNVPAMLELHFAVPGIAAVLVPINTRLGVSECTYILEHSGARCLVAHENLRGQIERIVRRLENPPVVIFVGGAEKGGDGYERRLREAARQPLALQDEDSLLSINYTSGTTGEPKGVMYSHRGAYLHALGVIAEAGLSPHSAYLWTLPMFHCNGWAFTWAVIAMGGCHVCLETFNAAEAWRLLHESDITHMCGAPSVLSILADAPQAASLRRRVRVFVGGAPPSPALLQRAHELGMQVTHLYGLTETYGPLAVCAWQPDWESLPVSEQVRLRARQGVATVVTQPLRVVDAELRDVPADGDTLGEVVMSGNNVTIGYYRDSEATERAFVGGVFHSGDLGVMHPDGYVELRDRSKDIIISGGENISTIEIEQTLAAHPAVAEAAVVGVRDERWGEVPRAFVSLRPEMNASAEELQQFVRGRLAGFKVPREIMLRERLPKTATGKVRKFLLRDAQAEGGGFREELGAP